MSHEKAFLIEFIGAIPPFAGTTEGIGKKFPGNRKSMKWEIEGRSHRAV
jgi:hypothetical protein